MTSASSPDVGPTNCPIIRVTMYLSCTHLVLVHIISTTPCPALRNFGTCLAPVVYLLYLSGTPAGTCWVLPGCAVNPPVHMSPLSGTCPPSRCLSLRTYAALCAQALALINTCQALCATLETLAHATPKSLVVVLLKHPPSTAQVHTESCTSASTDQVLHKYRTSTTQVPDE